LKKRAVLVVNITEKVKIGFKDYKVIQAPGPLVNDNSLVYGYIEYDNGEIHIANDHSIDTDNNTFVHECLHGIDDVVGIGLTEEQVNKLAGGVYAWIKDNPDIFASSIKEV